LARCDQRSGALAWPRFVATRKGGGEIMKQWRPAGVGAVLLLAAAGPVGAEPCPPGPGVDQAGDLVEILLCAGNSPRCKPDGGRVYHAARGAAQTAQVLTDPNIPDGYVISGGDLFSSTYDMATRGFHNLSISSHAGDGDYCSQHDLYELRVDYTGDDPSGRMKVEICLRYRAWPGAIPPGRCPPSVGH